MLECAHDLGQRHVLVEHENARLQLRPGVRDSRVQVEGYGVADQSKVEQVLPDLGRSFAWVDVEHDRVARGRDRSVHVEAPPIEGARGPEAEDRDHHQDADEPPQSTSSSSSAVMTRLNSSPSTVSSPPPVSRRSSTWDGSSTASTR